MPEKEHGLRLVKQRFGPHWILYLLLVLVLMLSIMAFTSPISQNNQSATPSPTAIALDGEVAPTAAALTATAESETLPPTPEEIGYTDGIIFWSTILILILLIGTLREALRRKRIMKDE